MENTRGQIYNRNRAKQVVNFNGLIYGNITPTDIDGLIDFHNKCFVFMELKYKDAPLPDGQRIAIENVIKSQGKPSIGIVASHDMPADRDINAVDCRVREIFYHGKWHVVKQSYSVKRMIDRFVDKYAPECLHINEVKP